MIDSVSVTRTVKVNLGNFENTDLSVTMVKHLDELDSEAEETAILTGKADVSIMIQLEELYSARGKKITRREISRRHGVPDRTAAV